MRVLIAVLLVACCALWHFSMPPSVGGGRADGITALWVKNRVYASVSPLDEQGFTRLTPANANGWYSIFQEPIQSLDYYRKQGPRRPTPQRRTLVLQPIGSMNREQQALLRDLADYAGIFFQLPVRIAAPLSLDLAQEWTRPRKGPNPTFSAGKGQYDAGKIIEHVLLPRLPEDAAAYLGITMADLWSGDLGYVFGVGSFDRRIGVYSLCRYFPEFWTKNKPKIQNTQDQIQTLRRACQVLNHEAGHMFGLMHCVLYKCSMNGSNSLDDADTTPLDYCPVCHRKLLWNIGLDGVKRYQVLLRFYQRHGLVAEARWTAARLERWQKITRENNG